MHKLYMYKPLRTNKKISTSRKTYLVRNIKNSQTVTFPKLI